MATINVPLMRTVGKAVAGLFKEWRDGVDARFVQARAELADEIKQSTKALADDTRSTLGDHVFAMKATLAQAAEDAVDRARASLDVRGDKGDEGPRGPAGAGLFSPVWELGKVHRQGAIVQHHIGQFFQAQADTVEEPGPNAVDWVRLGTAGFRMTGGFDSTVTYADGDLYVKDFGLFLHQAGAATCIAARGSQGKEGRKGDAGADGASIDVVELKGSRLALVWKQADGSQRVDEVDFVPMLEASLEVVQEALVARMTSTVHRAARTAAGAMFPVGTVLQSVLPEAQFRASIGADAGEWIEADGRALKSGTFAPDLRARAKGLYSFVRVN